MHQVSEGRAFQPYGSALMPLQIPTERMMALPRLHVPMDLGRIVDFPILARCLDVWRSNARNGLPATVDPTEMPLEAIKGISLVDRDGESGEWIVRLASTLMDQGHGQSMSGCVLSQTYRDEDFPGVLERLEAILAAGEPNLARHEFTGSRNRRWAYVRLILPLSSDGVARDRYALLYDPATFGRRIGT